MTASELGWANECEEIFIWLACLSIAVKTPNFAFSHSHPTTLDKMSD